MKTIDYWMDAFKNAHKNSWPKVMYGISKDIYQRDKKMIVEAAKKNNFVLIKNWGNYFEFGQGDEWKQFEVKNYD